MQGRHERLTPGIVAVAKPPGIASQDMSGPEHFMGRLDVAAASQAGRLAASQQAEVDYCAILPDHATARLSSLLSLLSSLLPVLRPEALRS